MALRCLSKAAVNRYHLVSPIDTPVLTRSVLPLSTGVANPIAVVSVFDNTSLAPRSPTLSKVDLQDLLKIASTFY